MSLTLELLNKLPQSWKYSTTTNIEETHTTLSHSHTPTPHSHTATPHPPHTFTHPPHTLTHPPTPHSHTPTPHSHTPTHKDEGVRQLLSLHLPLLLHYIATEDRHELLVGLRVGSNHWRRSEIRGQRLIITAFIL